MKKVFITMFVLAALAAICLPASAQDNAKLVGAWNITLETPQGSRNVPLEVKEENGKLVPSQPFTMAEIKGNDVTLKMTVKFQDNDLPITYTGKLEGDSMKGDADFGGFASGTWTAKRRVAGTAPTGLPAGVTPPASAPTAGVAGTWELTIESPQGKRTVELMIKDEGGKLSGKMKNQQGETALDSLTLSGADIAFKMTRDIQGQQMVFAYKGKVEGNKMKGEVDFGGMATGSWEAAKK